MKKSDALKTFSFCIGKVFNYLLDFVWPQFCLGCNQEGSICCSFCINDILLKENSQITWPEQSKTYFSACYVCCDYKNKLVRKLIKSYKYSYLENLAPILVEILEKQARQITLPPDTIISNIPLHPKKKRQRGFDQTELLAKKLAKQLNLTYQPTLQRVRHTKAQAQLDQAGRQTNLQNAFCAAPLRQTQDRGTLILIDDVATTGTTLNQAAKELKKAAWPKIVCLVLAKN